MREAMRGDPDFARVLREFHAAEPAPKRVRRQLLEKASRLTPRMAPAVYRVIDRVRQRLGLEAPVEVFCFQDPDVRAYVVPPERDHLLLAFASGALEALRDEELAFVAGHELAHALYDHLSLNA